MSHPSLLSVISGYALLAALSNPPVVQGQSCEDCHPEKPNAWLQSAHARTQVDVATELAQSHPGETPAAVIQGEDCIACHSPNAVFANGPMTEAKALGYFFTTSNGVFTAGTTATNTANWPHIDCTSCHNVPGDHPNSPASLALLESRTRPVCSDG